MNGKVKTICDRCKSSYYKYYRPECEFKFNIFDYPMEFDLDIIKKLGYYSPINKKNNPTGISRDHMFSVKDGYTKNISPEIIKHPANCLLILNRDNQSKGPKSSITIEELMDKIKRWDEKYKTIKPIG
jgi:hypothetical protein